MTPALRWLLVAAAQARPVFEVPKHRLDFSADTDAILQSQCREPVRLPKSIRQHLYWYAMVSSEDPELLRHFLDFYAGRGVRLAEKGRARLLLHPPLNMNMTTHRLTKNIVNDAFGSAIKKNVREVSDFSSEIKRDGANEFLKTLPKDALLMFPDLDEFFDAPSKDMERTTRFARLARCCCCRYQCYC